MDVILLKDVEKLGLRGEVVSVARGYMRNYLQPRKLAEQATEARVAELAKRESERARHEARTADQAEAIAETLRKTVLRFEVNAGERGTLFGSVTSTDITDELWRARKIRVDRRKIDLSDPIKRIGRYEIPITVFEGVVVEVKTLVVPIGGELPPEEELEAYAAEEAAEAEAAAEADRQAAADAQAAIEEVVEAEEAETPAEASGRGGRDRSARAGGRSRRAPSRRPRQQASPKRLRSRRPTPSPSPRTRRPKAASGPAPAALAGRALDQLVVRRALVPARENRARFVGHDGRFGVVAGERPDGVPGLPQRERRELDLARRKLAAEQVGALLALEAAHPRKDRGAEQLLVGVGVLRRRRPASPPAGDHASENARPHDFLPVREENSGRSRLEVSGTRLTEATGPPRKRGAGCGTGASQPF